MPGLRSGATALLGLTAAAGLVQAQGGLGFGLIGVAEGQSLRVHVLNLGNRHSVASSRCEVTVRFINAKDETLRDGVVTVSAGQGATVELHRGQMSGPPGRAIARAVVLFGPPAGGAPPGPEARQAFDCNIVPTLEVVDDASGRAAAVLTETRPLPVPDPRAVN